MLTPDSKVFDQPAELLPRFCQVICTASAGRIGSCLDHAHPLQASQALAQHTGRSAVQTLEDLIEVMVPGSDLAENQRSPALGENFRRTRHRTELPIDRHVEIVDGLGEACKYEFRSDK